MPYPNEHACRVRDPGSFQKGSFRRIKQGKLSVIIGKLQGKTTTTTQAYRYPKKDWTESQARAHCQKHEGKFEAAAKEIDVMEPDLIEIDESETCDKEADTGERGKTQIAYMIPLGATSFDDVDEYIKAQEVQERVSELTRQFRDLSWNILHNEEIENKASALRSLVDELDSRLGDAVSNQNGDKSVFGIIKGLFTKKKEPEKEKSVDRSSLILWKEGDRYRFMTIYTNKYRDEDNPPEILAEVAHERFLKEIEDGVHPYPDLLHWHIDGTKWGKSDWLHYDKDTGFMLASGFIDKGHEKEAEAIMALDEPIKTSHGMPYEFIERDKEDRTIITAYVSKEISDLPEYAAANQLTGFTIVKEVDDMSIPDEKKDYLKKVGLSDEAIAQIETDLGSKAKTAEEAGLEFKEGEVVTAEEIAVAEVVDLIEEPEGETEQPTEPQFTTREEVAEAITEVVAPLQESVKSIVELVQGLVKSDEEKIAGKAADTPAASIAALVARNFRAVGSDKTKADGDEEKGPMETDPEKNITGIPFIDKMLTEKE